MAKKTVKQCLIDGLLATGWRVDPHARTQKYLTFIKDGVGRRFLVGKSGALRLLTTGETSVARSISLTRSITHMALVDVGRQSEHWTSIEQAERAYQAHFGEARTNA